MAELLTERIRRNARELKLYGLDESADSLVERAERGKLGYRESSTSCSRTRSRCSRVAATPRA